jgi:hypothetical protein
MVATGDMSIQAKMRKRNSIPFTVENQTKFVLAGGFCIHCLKPKDYPFTVHCRKCADFKTHETNSVCSEWLRWVRNGT